jgi:hypothetical protein
MRTTLLNFFGIPSKLKKFTRPREYLDFPQKYNSMYKIHYFLANCLRKEIDFGKVPLLAKVQAHSVYNYWGYMEISKKTDYFLHAHNSFCKPHLDR